MKTSLPIIILGAGGHAKVLIDALRLQSLEIIAIVDADLNKKGQALMGVPVVGSDDEVTKYTPQSVRLVNGIGSVGVNPLRRQLFERFKSKGYQFEKVIHPSATIATDVVLSEGAQIMAGVVVQTGCQIGANAIINTRASVDHDCQIGNHVHISPGSVLSGGVFIQENAHIGAGAVIIQGIQIGKNSFVAAGAVVICNVLNDVTVAGMPARELVR